MVVSVWSDMVSWFCVRPYVQEVVFEDCPSDHETWSNWCHVGFHVDFRSILHSHTSLVSQAQCEANLDWLRHFHQWLFLKCNGHGLSISCVNFTHKPRAVTMNLWEPKRKCPKVVPAHIQNHLAWSRLLKCSVKSYVSMPSTKCYFNGFLLMWVLTHDKIE